MAKRQTTSAFVKIHIRKGKRWAEQMNGYYGPFSTRDAAVTALEQADWERVGCKTPTPEENKWFGFCAPKHEIDRTISYARIEQRRKPIPYKGREVPENRFRL